MILNNLKTAYRRYVPEEIRVRVWKLRGLLDVRRQPPANPQEERLVIESEKFFVASDGRRIEFVNGWFERTKLPPAYKSYVDYVEKLVKRQTGETDRVAYPVDIGLFIDKVNEAETVLNVLRESFISFDSIQSMLDIGTGPAIIPRIFKMMGFVQETYGIDIIDRDKDFPDAVFLNNLYILREQIQNNQIPEHLAFNLLRSHSFIPDRHPLSLFLSLDLSNEFAMDDYILGDFETWDFKGQTFDLVVTHTGLFYFDMKRYFKKVASLLNPGGIHFLLDPNWYHVDGTVMYLPMDAPWLHTRLPRDDFLRYYQEFHPDIANYVEKGIFFKDSHYTPIDVADCARGEGLKVITLRRYFDEQLRHLFSYKFPDNLEYLLDVVRPEARLLNPNADVVDFLTYTFTMLFQKVR